MTFLNNQEISLFDHIHLEQNQGVLYNLVPSKSFRSRSKAKKKPWNTSNTWSKFAQIEGKFLKIN